MCEREKERESERNRENAEKRPNTKELTFFDILTCPLGTVLTNLFISYHVVIRAEAADKRNLFLCLAKCHCVHLEWSCLRKANRFLTVSGGNVRFSPLLFHFL